MVDALTLSRLLEVLYQTPFQPERWETFLELICEYTGSRGAYLMGTDHRRNMTIQVQGGLVVDASVLQKYALEIAPADPYRAAVIRKGHPGFFFGEDLLEHSEYLASDMYRLQNSHFGLVHPATLVLTCTLKRMDVISIWRTLEQGPLPAQYKELFELLEPHVRGAINLRQKIGALRERVTGLEAVIDASDTAIFLTSGSGSIRHCNESARELLLQAEALFEKEGAISAKDANAQHQMQMLLRELAAPQPGSQFRSSRPLLLPRENAAPLQALLVSLSRTSAGSVLIIVTDPERPATLAEGTLAAFYRLTPSEEEIADGLLTGYSLDEISLLRKTSVGTTRQQLKSIFSKTGTRNQADLIRLLCKMPTANV